jgi:hypothetical protein
MKPLQALAIALLATSLGLATACGPGRSDRGGPDLIEPNPDPDPDPKPERPKGDDWVEARLLPRAGDTIIVRVPSRQAWILVQPGAIKDPVDLTIERLRPSSFDEPGAEELLEGVYSFSPKGLRLREPATLRLPFGGLDATGMEVELLRRHRFEWRVVEGADVRVGSDSVTAIVTRLGTYGLRIRPVEEPPAEGEPDQAI